MVSEQFKRQHNGLQRQVEAMMRKYEARKLANDAVSEQVNKHT
jgi:hypothetical protein